MNVTMEMFSNATRWIMVDRKRLSEQKLPQNRLKHLYDDRSTEMLGHSEDLVRFFAQLFPLSCLVSYFLLNFKDENKYILHICIWPFDIGIFQWIKPKCCTATDDTFILRNARILCVFNWWTNGFMQLKVCLVCHAHTFAVAVYMNGESTNAGECLIESVWIMEHSNSNRIKAVGQIYFRKVAFLCVCRDRIIETHKWHTHTRIV